MTCQPHEVHCSGAHTQIIGVRGSDAFVEHARILFAGMTRDILQAVEATVTEGFQNGVNAAVAQVIHAGRQ